MTSLNKTDEKQEESNIKQKCLIKSDKAF